MCNLTSSPRPWLQDRFDTITDEFTRKGSLPDSNVIIHGFCLQQREVDVDPVAGRDSDQPNAVLQDWVLVWKSRGINGTILRCHIISTRS